MNTAPIYTAVEAENWSGAGSLLQTELEPHTHQFKVQFAVNCARSVLHVFEEKHPKDKRPRTAIEAAEKWLAEPTEENRKAAYAASNAAYAVSYVSHAAAYAAANADACAAACATNADAYTSNAATRKSKWQELIHMYEQMVRKEKLSHLCSVA